MLLIKYVKFKLEEYLNRYSLFYIKQWYNFDMTRENIYEFIKSKNIWYLIEEHKPVFNMNELKNINLKYPESDKKIDIKEFKNKYNTRHLSFARENDLKEILGLTAGSVSLLGILKSCLLKVM